MEPVGYPIFKGLQKPLEFMGIRGRFLVIAAATIGLSFLGFLLVSFLLGKIVGFIAMIAIIAFGLISIYIKQKTGLHNKKIDRAIFIYKNIERRT